MVIKLRYVSGNIVVERNERNDDQTAFLCLIMGLGILPMAKSGTEQLSMGGNEGELEAD